MLTNIFTRKLKQVMVRSEVPTSEEFRRLHEDDTDEDETKPIRPCKSVEIVLSFLSILQVVVYFVAATLALTFHQLNHSDHLHIAVLLNQLLEYDIKCRDYCIVYQLSKEKFKEIILHNPYNYQYYCLMRDKDQYNPN